MNEQFSQGKLAVSKIYMYYCYVGLQRFSEAQSIGWREGWLAHK